MKIMWLFILFIFVIGGLFFLSFFGMISILLGIFLSILAVYLFGEIYKRLQE